MKRTVFRNPWLPYLLVAPQVAITLVFFFWPAFDSLRLSLYRSSPFGDKLIWVGLANFQRLFGDRAYLRSAVTTFIFSFLVTFAGMGVALLLAALANAKIRGLSVYRTLLLWPYGIAPAIAGIIWLFIFHPSYGILPYVLSFVTAYQFNWFLKGWVALPSSRWPPSGSSSATTWRSTWPGSRPFRTPCSRRPVWTAPDPSGASSP
jgi:sn-glycerol 3-phosphate transport system permease protein